MEVIGRNELQEKVTGDMEGGKRKKVSFVIPCYRSEQSLPHVVAEIREKMGQMDKYEYDVFLVNDSSPDGTFGVIRRLCQEDRNIKGIDFAKNFGQHSALMAGLRHSDGDYVVCLDEDGQTPADEVDRLLDKLEEGSIVCGRIRSYMADDVSVTGNGILYGAVWHKPDENGGRLMAEFSLGRNILVQGITIVDNGVWNIVPGACTHVEIRDVNVLSRLVTGDGIDIVGCQDVLVEHCFIRAADDCVVIKACPLPTPAACCDVKNVVVRDCVLWNAEPGNALEIGYELRCREVSDIVYSDCDVIHCEYEGNQSGGVFTIHNADRARVHNVVYEDIRIEDAQEKLVDIKILDSKYSLDRVRGEVEDVYFRNITVEGPVFPVSIIRGFEMHQEIRWPRRIHFENVVVHGSVMRSANQMRMVVELAHELEFEGEMDHMKRDF